MIKMEMSGDIIEYEMPMQAYIEYTANVVPHLISGRVVILANFCRGVISINLYHVLVNTNCLILRKLFPQRAKARIQIY